MPTVSLTASEAALQLTRYGLSWSPALGEPAVLTYAYRASEPANMPADTSGFVRFTAEQIALGERSFALWADAANIVFVRVGSGTEGEGAYSDDATILVGNYTNGRPGVTAFSSYPGNPDPLSPAGDIWHNIASPLNAFIHERGHAFGLQHPSEYDVLEGETFSYDTHADYIQDSWQYTVMSYFRETETGADWGGAVPRGLMMHDIAAIQRLYGANMSTRTGDTTYGFNSNSGWDYMTLLNSADPAVFCIWDAGGVDTIDMSGYAQNGFINLAAESFSSVGGLTFNVSIAMGASIENAIGGSGDDTLLGNDADNELDGGVGADTMRAGDGDDVYIVDNAGDVTTEAAGQGVDTVQSSITRNLTANIENLVLTGAAAITGFGNVLANTITGNAAANQLYGFDGNDTLDGGAGADAMFGGMGDDSYIVDDAGDITSEASATGGSDTVFSSVTRNLTANIENLVLTGVAAITGFGNVLSNTIAGNSAANMLYGFDGDDVLDGAGGDDVMWGAFGDDTYYVDSAGDITVEGQSLGVDTVITSVSRNLNANFENMTLVGAATIGYGNVLANVMTGSAIANSLYGFDGDDSLDGRAGADSMFGGNGNDTYFVDNTGDVTSEASALGGTDTVFSSVTRNLSANIENLTLTGVSFISGYGNVLDNSLTGNAVANSLHGFDGADTLFGAGGADTLYGGAGGDRLDGGFGIDTLIGGDGADTFVFTRPPWLEHDVIQDFVVADDSIELDAHFFTNIGAMLDAAEFQIGATATEADDRIIYDPSTGALYFDPDGSGVGSAQTHFATLAAGLAVTHADFIIMGGG